MKKIYFASLAAMLLSIPASAQKLTLLQPEDGTMPATLCISPDGKYIGGTDYYSYSGFVCDWQAGNFKWLEPADEFGCEIRSINNDGIGTGFNGPAITFDINGNVTTIGEANTIGEAISADGSLICGSITKGEINTAPVLWRDGKMVSLPEPSTKYAGTNVNGSTAKYMNSDGTVLVGQIVDDMATYPMVVWHQNRDGETYSADPVCRFYVRPDKDGNKLCSQFSATNISSNGKYVAVTLAWSEDEIMRFGRYDLEADTLEAAPDPEDADLKGQDFVSSGIADDGTMIGYIGEREMGSRTAAIWKAGDKAPMKLSQAFPTVTELADFDATYPMTTPTAITPDGRYIAGFAMDADGFLKTFVLDTTADPTAVEGVEAEKAKAKVTARYNVAGQKMVSAAKGINIIKMSDGRGMKVAVK